MSSTYSTICLSHDPAIILTDIEYADIDGLRDRDHPAVSGHTHCDIAVGRFSYPLIELACLGHLLAGPTGCKATHISVKWMPSEWLRLLTAATPHVDPTLLGPFTTHGCWPTDRLNRLRDELRLPEPTTAPAPAPKAHGLWISGLPVTKDGACTAGLGPISHDDPPVRPCTIEGPHLEHKAADGTRWTNPDEVRTGTFPPPTGHTLFGHTDLAGYSPATRTFFQLYDQMVAPSLAKFAKALAAQRYGLQ